MKSLLLYLSFAVSLVAQTTIKPTTAENVAAVLPAAIPLAGAAEVRAAAEIDLSTVGGDDTVPQFSANGDLTTGAFENDGLNLNPGGNISIPDMRGLRWMGKDGNLGKTAIYSWDDHGGAGLGNQEFLITSDWRMALIANGGTQFGANDSARYVRKLQMVSGAAVGTDPALEYMPSGVLSLQTNVWTGSASARNEMAIQAHPLDTTGTNSVMRFYDESTVNGEDERGPINEAGRGYVEGNLIAEIYRDGIWSAGTAPAFDALDDLATVEQVCSKYKNVQAAAVTITDNRSLSISGLLAGMRGVIYVTQDGTGSRALTPLGGSALGLSTTAGVTDRVSWDFDGLYVNFTVDQAVQREVIVADADAAAFIAAASLTDAGQKAAVSTLVDALKAASVGGGTMWNAFYALYPFVGGNATAHAQDLKGTYPITWAGAAVPTHSSAGVTGTATGYGLTGVNLFTLSAQNSASLYVYNKSSSVTSGTCFIGAYDASFYRAQIGVLGSSVTMDGLNSSGVSSGILASGGDFRSHLAATRLSSTTQEIYGFGVSASANATSVGAVNQQIAVLARGRATPDQISNANLAFAAIGQSLTSGEWTTFRSIIDAFQTALTRANP